MLDSPEGLVLHIGALKHAWKAKAHGFIILANKRWLWKIDFTSTAGKQSYTKEQIL